MWRSVKNIVSYLWFVFSLDWFQLISTVIDIVILVWSFVNWKEIALQPTLVLVFIGILTTFIWQIFNVASHFTFLRKEDPAAPLDSLLKKDKDGNKLFGDIHISKELTDSMSYKPNVFLGILENERIDEVLNNNNSFIEMVLSGDRDKVIRVYILQYKETLLKFLNHRWYEIVHKKGDFTNDAKICFSSELFHEDGHYKWKVSKGRYYDGVLTNSIFSKYVGGSHFKLYPPVNLQNTGIGVLGGLDFSDHIGVSTMLYTTDGYVLVLKQAGKSAEYPDRYMPSGSGSLDYADFVKGEDLRQLVIRGAERELSEENSLKKTLPKKTRLEKGIIIETFVLKFYRDLERGGKPEFSCISRINKGKESVKDFFKPNTKEMAYELKWGKIGDSNFWEGENGILKTASLSLKVCYEAAKEYTRNVIIKSE